MLVPLLQNEALEQVSRGFREYSRSQASVAVLFGILLAAAAAVAVIYAVFSGRERMVGRRTFLRMARASGLARSETTLLVAVSRRVLPDNPPEIFVRRSLFESAVADMHPDPATVESLRKKVYGP
ncbi:MAG TPA: hypothetical protein VMU54_02990 [Planctomycetota bacterium]|nr:hypothetical protein [Planctomycetota bacterium]